MTKDGEWFFRLGVIVLRNMPAKQVDGAFVSPEPIRFQGMNCRLALPFGWVPGPALQQPTY
jgi:hypothetical protein